VQQSFPRPDDVRIRYHETDMTTSDRPRIEIEYCTQCRWLLRAAWMAQELLLTFEQEVGGVTLIPGAGGIFEIRVGDTLLWSRKDQGGFPEIKELKRLVRDRIAPGKDLGHIDR
jgi:selenoprotein W-related protein